MSETRICANCGEDHPLDAMFRVGSDWLCESCADEFTVICDACGERIYSEDVIRTATTRSAKAALMRITSVVQIATAFCGVTARTVTEMTAPTAHPAGMSTARSSTSTATRPIWCFTAKACGISA